MARKQDIGEVKRKAWLLVTPSRLFGLRRIAVRRRLDLLLRFMDSGASAGLVLMGVAALALIIAQSSWSKSYFEALHYQLGPFSLLHWINDGLMVLFFLQVGLEIKHELIRGALSTPAQRWLPCVAAGGGMLVPALIFVLFNRSHESTIHGWAIPTATDIAFALGVMALLGKRVPASLRIFLTALAIIDDLGAVVIIALFYGGNLHGGFIATALGLFVLMLLLNRWNVNHLGAYLALGFLLWLAVLWSGVHATIAGVLTAFAVPLGERQEFSPLNRLEAQLRYVVPFVVLPIFSFANAGVAPDHIHIEILGQSLTLGVALGLFIGKPLGVLSTSLLLVWLGLTGLPKGATWTQMVGVAFLCGIGFTMSLFVGGLAYAGNPLLQEEAKIGILLGSMTSGVVGLLILAWASPRQKKV